MFVDPWGLAPSPTEAAEMARHIYNATIEDYKQNLGDAFGGWILTEIYDNDDGLKMGVYRKMRDDGYVEYSIVNRGTSDWGTLTKPSDELKNNIQMGIMISQNQFDSMVFAGEFVNTYYGFEVTMVGHSKGGAEAIFNALWTGTNCITFNPYAQSINKESSLVKYYTGEMVHFVVSGDALNKYFGKAKVGQTIPLYTQVWDTKKTWFGGIKKVPNERGNHSMNSVINGLWQKGYTRWEKVKR
jgi:hypothetical protein